MSTIQELFQQAQLAESAYANFFSNSGARVGRNIQRALRRMDDIKTFGAMRYA